MLSKFPTLSTYQQPKKANNELVHTPPPHILSVDSFIAADATGDSDLVALKNEHRIERLHVRLRAFKEATFEASPIARVVRRDWNILSAKLYLNARDPEYRKKIEADMKELGLQIHDTAADVRSMPFEHLERSWLHPRRMHIQVVHPITAMWLRSMQTWDEMYAVLICAEKTGLITNRQRKSLMLPCQLSYLSFKCTAMKIALKTSDELLSESGL